MANPDTQTDPPHQPFVRAIVVHAIGSTPADAGATMIVTEAGRHSGTVGGGRIEARAIAEAQDLLRDTRLPPTRFFEWNLHHDIGMTCGGVMKLYFERCNVPAWEIVIFGAGHVAQALVRLCQTLPCRITCIDPRQEWLDRLPDGPTIRKIPMDEPAQYVPQLPPNSFIICMTRGHHTDRPILEAILKGTAPSSPSPSTLGEGRGEGPHFPSPCALGEGPAEGLPPYIGVIGSRSKAAVLRRELAEAGIPPARLDRIICPIGLPIGTNHPAEIAVSIAAQLLQHRDQLRVSPKESATD
jgi:xanthine dehydrogenase accessory factor